jgi:hypothetical protein
MRIRKRIANNLVMVAIATIGLLPTALYLAAIAAAAHAAPNYCNNAGGCPWTS